jgi:predicted anti-sigma-YlaC factor YlaD
MNNDLHIRAQQLIAKQRVEGVSAEEQTWLAAHLAECESCSALQAETAQAIASLRRINIDVPKNLVARTQLRVRLRAEELPKRTAGRLMLWSIAAVSWLLGVASAPFVWRGFEWAGTELHLPKLVWASGVVLWWLVPALVATGVVLRERLLTRTDTLG